MKQTYNSSSNPVQLIEGQLFRKIKIKPFNQILTKKASGNWNQIINIRHAILQVVMVRKSKASLNKKNFSVLKS